MIRLWPAANIGIVTGISSVTVVDVDGSSDLVAVMLARFGNTPLQTRTPSGGVHLWYRSSGERCANLRSEGFPVDVKGKGGIIVVPPSVRPSGNHAGRAYDFIEGSWDDLARLPMIRPGSLKPPHSENDNRATGLIAVRRGQRNDTLFRALLRQAPHCDDFGALLDCARTTASLHLDADANDPFTDAEVHKVAASAWKYELEGNNWVRSEARVYTTVSEFNALAAHSHGSDGLLLLTKLRLAHWNRSSFTISPKAMQRVRVIPGWAHGRYRNARGALIETGILRMLHEGGRGGGDTCRCAFASPVVVKGLKAGHNITEHPPPLSMWAEDHSGSALFPRVRESSWPVVFGKSDLSGGT
jgi:hypothetical protein